MTAIAGFSVGRHPDSALARNGAFVFAYTASDTALGIDMRLLKFDQYVEAITRLRMWIEGEFSGNSQTSFPVGDNFSREAVPWW